MGRGARARPASRSATCPGQFGVTVRADINWKDPKGPKEKRGVDVAPSAGLKKVKS